MSIQKKSLISTLKTTKKANMVKDEISDNTAKASPTTKSPTRLAPSMRLSKKG
jgi:hypothetical protein